MPAATLVTVYHKVQDYTVASGFIGVSDVCMIALRLVPTLPDRTAF